MTTSEQPVQEFLTLEQVTSKYAPAYHDSWNDWWKDEGHATSSLIDSLVEELREHGKFEEPVILCAETTEVDDETGEEEFYPANVGNGMHRLAAHYRSGIDPVFVQHGWTPSPAGSTEEPSLIVVTRSRTHEERFDVFDEIYETLSWRHEGTHRSPWLSLEFGAGVGAVEELWLVGGDPTKDSLSAIFEDVKSRIGHLVEVEDIRWSYFNEDGEEIEYVNPDVMP